MSWGGAPGSAVVDTASRAAIWLADWKNWPAFSSRICSSASSECVRNSRSLLLLCSIVSRSRSSSLDCDEKLLYRCAQEP